jgi:hypothetical protein
MSKHAESKADGHCDETSACDEIGTKLRLEAQARGNASTAAFAIGGVLAVAGIVLVVTAPAPEKKSSQQVQAGPWIGPSSVAIRGHW